MGELSVFLGGMEELSVLRVVWGGTFLRVVWGGTVLRVVWGGTVLHYFLLHKKWTSVMTVI